MVYQNQFIFSFFTLLFLTCFFFHFLYSSLLLKYLIDCKICIIFLKSTPHQPKSINHMLGIPVSSAHGPVIGRPFLSELVSVFFLLTIIYHMGMDKNLHGKTGINYLLFLDSLNHKQLELLCDILSSTQIIQLSQKNL